MLVPVCAGAQAQRDRGVVCGESELHVTNGKGGAMAAIQSFVAGLRARVKRQEGQAMVEYALILGLVSVVAIVLLTAVGQDITSLLAKVTSALASAL
jgi:pilus assembly protein Flp/PilA